MAVATSKSLVEQANMHGAERQFAVAQVIWNLAVISLPLDLIIGGLAGRYLFASYDCLLLALGLFIFSVILTFRALPQRALSNLRKLKAHVASAKNGSKFKAWIFFGVAFLLTGLDVLIHMFHLSWNAVGMAIGALAIVLVATFRSYHETKEWSEKLASNPKLRNEMTNNENLILVILPSALLRIAALSCAAALLMNFSLQATLLYAAILLAFQQAFPQRSDFFQICRRCAGNFPREMIENNICPGCISRR